MELREIIAANLRRYRIEVDLTQGEVAEYLGMKTGAYQHYEGKRAIPCITILFKLSELYGLPSLHSFLVEDDKALYKTTRDVVYRAYCMTKGNQRKAIDYLLGLNC